MDVIVPWRVIYEAQHFDIEGFSVEIHFDLKLGFERIQPEKKNLSNKLKKKTYQAIQIPTDPVNQNKSANCGYSGKTRNDWLPTTDN